MSPNWAARARRSYGSTNTVFFFSNDTATTKIYTLSLHDALPISPARAREMPDGVPGAVRRCAAPARSEEHTSDLQSHSDLVCRLLLEKKKQQVLHSRESHALQYAMRDRLVALGCSEVDTVDDDLG